MIGLEIVIDGNHVSLTDNFMILKQFEPEIFHFLIVSLRKHCRHFEILDFFDSLSVLVVENPNRITEFQLRIAPGVPISVGTSAISISLQ